ncbi:hypothetical protein ACFVAJ_17735 [Agromyces sp. NPDC057679]|uniref:hypothetical protein n=1 Tax=Agromyces sp. NPDC057679 TaxID=3346207 RepID=UPI0036704D0B
MDHPDPTRNPAPAPETAAPGNAEQLKLQQIRALTVKLDPRGKILTRDYATTIRARERQDIVEQIRAILDGDESEPGTADVTRTTGAVTRKAEA